MSKKAFKDTGLGKFVTEKIPAALQTIENILPEHGAMGIIKNIIDESTLSPEEKEEADRLAEEFEFEYFKLAVQDKANARDMNVKINESINASWLSKNIAAILAIIWTVVAGFILIYSIINPTMADPNVITAIVGIVGSITGFYFGSSVEKSKK